MERVFEAVPFGIIVAVVGLKKGLRALPSLDFLVRVVDMASCSV